MNGFEAARAIRALSGEDVKNIFIIVMTENAMEEGMEAALKCGMNTHIARPFDVENFIAILGRFLNL